MSENQSQGMQTNLRWNYTVHVIEGGFFMGGIAIVNATTVLPAALQQFGGPAWLIALAPVMMGAGTQFAPMFTAHWIDRLRRYMPMLMVTGVFQRLPYLLVGILLLLSAGSAEGLRIAAVALTPLVSGLFCGISLAAWQQLVANTVPVHRRSSLFASRYMIGTFMGLFAGMLVKSTLRAHPGAGGYARLHLMAFGVLSLSYMIFAMLRETPVAPRPAHEPRHDLIDNWRSLPGLLRAHPPLARYMVLCVTLSAVYIIAPFLALHIRSALGKPAEYVGVLLVVQMVGGMVGNLTGGWLGDKFGGRRVLLLAQTTLATLALATPFLHSESLLLGVFFLFGFALFAGHIGRSATTLEMVPMKSRSTCLAMVGMVQFLSMLGASGLSTLLKSGGGFTLNCLAVAIIAGVSIPLILRLPAPSACSNPCV
ncbi:MAG: MFS transporter [Lentisphaeria bacterium]|nr:MFS transporter [Lentisphaeria bacterium]